MMQKLLAWNLILNLSLCWDGLLFEYISMGGNVFKINTFDNNDWKYVDSKVQSPTTKILQNDRDSLFTLHLSMLMVYMQSLQQLLLDRF